MVAPTFDDPAMNQTNQTFLDEKLDTSLDSTNAFEGPEKLLEIWFAPTASTLPGSADPNGLRAVPQSLWEEMLDIVQCKVLSTTACATFDSYLLSESSMFVFPHKIILKTCGTTTTLIGIPKLFDIIRDFGFPDYRIPGVRPYRVFYSRRAFMFPDRQKPPHRTWTDEVEFLDGIFTSGAAYTVGNLKSNHWHLYITEPAGEFADYSSEDVDETLELMMSDLAPQAAAQFSHDRSISHASGHSLGAELTTATKIDQLYPAQLGIAIDAFAFSPCGYSCNAVLPSIKTGGHYFTIHITPENGWSYASFESNIPSGEAGVRHQDIVEKNIAIAQPGRFACTLFHNKKSGTDFSLQLSKLAERLGYKKIDKIVYDLDDYELLFASFELLKR